MQCYEGGRPNIESARGARIEILNKQLDTPTQRRHYGDDEVREHWTDALVLWRQELEQARTPVLTSVGVKLASLDDEIAPGDMMIGWFAQLPSTAFLLTNAV